MSEEIAWAAGLLEGEGWFTLAKQRENYYQPQVGCNMTDLEPIVKLQELFGGTVREVDKKNPRWQLQYKWQLYTLQDIEDCLAVIYDHMSPRRKEQIERIWNNLHDSIMHSGSGNYDRPKETIRQSSAYVWVDTQTQRALT